MLSETTASSETTGRRAHPYRAIAIGASFGGPEVLQTLLAGLPASFRWPIFIVQHRSSGRDGAFAQILAQRCALPVVNAYDKMPIRAGHVYVAPPNYHLLVERHKHLALSVDAKEHFVRPAANILLESAAEAYLGQLVAVILTGANADGASGLKRVYELGGLTIVQSPDSALARAMPEAAIATGCAQHVLEPTAIAAMLRAL